MKSETGGFESIESARKIVGTSSSRKVLQVLFAFSEHRHEASVAELANIIGAPIPTTYRYVALLKELQLIEEGSAGRYHPTANIMPLARAAQLSNTLAEAARPVLEEAAKSLRETVMLFQYVGNAAVCVERAECDRNMRFTFEQGHSIPLGMGASGKMLLASLPPAARIARFAELVGLDDLEETISQVIENQYATSEGEIDDGVWACSVPVLGGDTRPAVLTLAGPESRIGDDARAAALTALHEYAQRIRTEYLKFRL